MESVHRRRLNDKFSAMLKSKKVIVLDIPDKYEFMEPELVSMLVDKVSRHLKLKAAD